MANPPINQAERRIAFGNFFALYFTGFLLMAIVLLSFTSSRKISNKELALNAQRFEKESQTCMAQSVKVAELVRQYGVILSRIDSTSREYNKYIIDGNSDEAMRRLEDFQDLGRKLNRLRQSADDDPQLGKLDELTRSLKLAMAQIGKIANDAQKQRLSYLDLLSKTELERIAANGEEGREEQDEANDENQMEREKEKLNDQLAECQKEQKQLKDKLTKVSKALSDAKGKASGRMDELSTSLQNQGFLNKNNNQERLRNAKHYIVDQFDAISLIVD